MCRPDTDRAVAGEVVEFHSYWNGTDSPFVGHPVRYASGTADADDPVALGIWWVCPIPAAA
jgi:hypothetical protein